MSFLGDGYCNIGDAYNNTESCEWDLGDCSKEVVLLGYFGCRVEDAIMENLLNKEATGAMVHFQNCE